MTNSIWIRILAFSAIAAVALFLRVDGLADSVLWYDESISSLRCTGHTEREAIASISSRGMLPITELQRFLEVDPSKGIGDTMHSLITEDAQHTPLYYVLAHYWAKAFGADNATVRILPVIFGMLILPAMFWLCLEVFVKTGIFASQAICWVAMLVAAVAPYNVGFAREHREYSLWMLALLLLSAAFFRALRVDTRRAWCWFAGALVVASYAHLISWLVWVVLALTLLVRERSLWTAKVRSFALASVVAGVLFVPWAVIVLENRHAIQQDLSWVNKLAAPERFNVAMSLVPHFRLADIALLDLSSPIEGQPGNERLMNISKAYPFLLSLGILWFSRRLRGDVAAFIGLMVLTITISTFVADLATGGVLGWVFRYAAPTILGWHLALAFLFACLVERAERVRHDGEEVGDAAPDLWRSLRIVLVAVVLALSGYGAYADATGITFPKRPNDRGTVADYVNLNGGVTLITDDYIGSLLALSRQVRPDLQLFARPRCLSCPDTRKIVEIPEFPPHAGKLVFYRSWMNIGHQSIRQPLQDSLGFDQFGDPRFHTKAVDVDRTSMFLYEIAPR